MKLETIDRELLVVQEQMAEHLILLEPGSVVREQFKQALIQLMTARMWTELALKTAREEGAR